MRHTCVLLSALVLAAVACDSWASQVDFTAQLRVRGEVDARDFNSDTAADVFTLQRTRFAGLFRTDNDLSVFVQLQDARTWGEETNTLLDGNADQFDLHQGYFLFENLFNVPLSLKIGRQEMIYSNERLVGAVGWTNTGRSLDGAVLGYDRENYTLDLLAARVGEAAGAPPGEVDEDQYFFGFWTTYTWNFGDNMTDGFILWDVNRDSIPDGPSAGDPMVNRWTVGANHTVTYRGIDAMLEGAFQFGKRGLVIAPDTTHSNVDISAWFFAVNLGYEFSDLAWKPWIGLGVDVLSGDDMNKKEYGAFNTLFATNHKFYGHMDYFTAPERDLQDLGLVDWLAKARVWPGEKVRIALDCHYFERQMEDRNRQSLLGYEIDAYVNWNYSSGFKLQSGYSVFVPREVVKTSGLPPRFMAGGDTAHWFYLQLLAQI